VLRLDAIKPRRDVRELQRVGTGVRGAVDVGVQRDVGNRVLVAGYERPSVG